MKYKLGEKVWIRSGFEWVKGKVIAGELFQMMEDYFKYDCMTVITKRDKDMIVGEVRKAAMDNLFKEEDNKIIDKNINTM